MLWANSYWSNAAWALEKTESTDLARGFFRDMAIYGIRFNLMHSISREERPEAQYPRTNVTVIGEAFNLVNTTDQDPNIKWFVVGTGGYKEDIYLQIRDWGFNITLCNAASEKKGYPYCGQNSIYNVIDAGADPNDRERSALFQYYEQLDPEPTPAPSADSKSSKKSSKKKKSKKEKANKA